MTLGGLVLITTPVIFVFVLTRKRFERGRVRAATTSVEASSAGVHRTLADGREEEVHWDEVNEVDVFHTRVGPHKPAGGGVVLYGTAERGCIVPLDKLEESGLLVHIHHLPGFDVAKLIDAIAADRRSPGASDSAVQFLTPRPLQTTVTCWTRTPVAAPAIDPGDDEGGADGGDPWGGEAPR